MKNQIQDATASLVGQARNALTKSLANMIAFLKSEVEARLDQASSCGKMKRSCTLTPPEKFSGTRKELDAFVFNCQQVLTVNHDQFVSTDAQIAWITSLLTGSAAETIRPYADRNGNLPFQTPGDLFTALRLNYADPDDEYAARTKILSLRQANREFSAYVSEFQLYAL